MYEDMDKTNKKIERKFLSTMSNLYTNNRLEI